MGYLMLFEELGLGLHLEHFTPRKGGNFGFFTSNEMAKAAQFKDLRGGQAARREMDPRRRVGHMWRVLSQYMDTWNGPADFLEVPKSPVTGTVFENAKSMKMVHVAEFTADLIKNNKLKLDPKRNDHLKVTWPRFL